MQRMPKRQGVHRPFSAKAQQTIRKPASRMRAGNSDSDHFHGIEDSLASEFSAHINELCLKAPLQHRRPSPLNPPTAAVAAQLDALQINDWPETDAGVYTAMAFAKPYECEQLLAAVPHHQPDSRPLTSKLQQQQLNHHQQQPPANNSGRSPSESKDSPDQGTAGAAGVRVRSWSASEQWLTPQQFIQQLHSPPYNVLLGCDSWRACSNMVFPATRVGKRAVQAVEVLAAPRQQQPSNNSRHHHSSSTTNNSSIHASQALQKYTFTFCLELISKGPYEGCWMTVGVRPGDYSV